MPARDLFQISPVKGGQDADLNALVVQVNRCFMSIAQALGKLEGLDGQLVKLRGDIDMGGRRVRGVGAPSDEGDVAARGVVAQLGALSRATQERVVVEQVIVANAGVETAPAVQNTQVPSLDQITDLLTTTGVTIAGAQTVTGQKTFSGGAIVGTGGTAITKVLSATATLDFPNTLPATGSDLTITVTGAAGGDTVFLGVPNASIPSSNCAFFSWVSAANTVTVRFINAGSLATDPASGTFRVAVVQF